MIEIEERISYTFHLGNKFKPLLPYLNEVSRRRHVRLSQVIGMALEYVLREQMLDNILDGKIRYESESTPPRQEIPQFLRAPSVNLAPRQVEDVDLLPRPTPRADLPAVKRRVPVPKHLMRPDFHQHRPTSNGLTSQREKTKAELREELRRAVENTR